MRKPIISIKTGARDYAGLINLGNAVVAGLSGNPSFLTPSPTTTSMTTAITNVVNSLQVWGPKGNRGSHADLVDLRQKALILRDMLKAEAQYVQNTAQAAAVTDYAAMAVIITTSGFSLANDHTPQGVLQKVQSLHQSVSRQTNRNQVKLMWKKPLNVLTVSNVKSYKVLRNTSADITTAVVAGIVTRRSFIDTNTTVGTTVTWTYWVIAYNADGAGVVSDPITVAVLGA